MKLLLYLAGLVVLSFIVWNVLVAANAKGGADTDPSAPKATLDHVRERTQHAVDEENKKIDEVMKQVQQDGQ